MNLSDGLLTIKGEKKEDKEEKNERHASPRFFSTPRDRMQVKDFQDLRERLLVGKIQKKKEPRGSSF